VEESRGNAISPFVHVTFQKESFPTTKIPIMRQTRAIVLEIFYFPFKKNQLPVNNSASGFFTLDAFVFLPSSLFSKIIIQNIDIEGAVRNYAAHIRLRRMTTRRGRRNHRLFGIFFLRSPSYCARYILSQKLHTHTRASPDGCVDYNFTNPGRPVRRNTSK